MENGPSGATNNARIHKRQICWFGYMARVLHYACVVGCKLLLNFKGQISKTFRSDLNVIQLLYTNERHFRWAQVCLTVSVCVCGCVRAPARKRSWIRIYL